VIDLGDYRSISDMGNSLINLIWSDIENDSFFRENVGLNSQKKIALSSPEEAQDQGIILTLFLYNINEDPNLKNMAPEQIWPNRTRRPSLPLSLYYMITPNAKTDDMNNLLMGRVMQIFNDNPIIRLPYLEGSLAGDDIKLMFLSLSIDDINKIWGVVGKSYKLSAYYEVAPVRIASKEVDTTGRISEAELKFRSGDGHESIRL
jgi:hypothetical protein